MKNKEYRKVVKNYDNGVTKVYIPILTEEEEQKRHERLYAAGVRIARAHEKAMIDQKTV